MKLTLGFSPCPNDTFIFDALVNGRIDTGGLGLEPAVTPVVLVNADITCETMPSRSSTRVRFLSTVPSFNSWWPTKSHGPAARNPVAINVFGSEGSASSPAICSSMNRA